MELINICLADDQVLFRQGVASLIKNVEGFNLVFEAENGIEFLEKLEACPQQPHVALIDIEMPRADGMELNACLQKSYPGLKAIILSVHSSPRLIARMIHDGACGYLQKNCHKDELITAIRSTHGNGFYINEQTLKAMQKISSTSNIVYKTESGIDIGISSREKEVLQMICLELTNAEIAEKLSVSPRTVDGHRNNLLSKTCCRNTAGLVLFAIKHHIFEILF